jgi:hypothetical protein
MPPQILQGAKNDLIRRRQIAKMERVEDKVCTLHLNQLKESVSVSENDASMKS